MAGRKLCPEQMEQLKLVSEYIKFHIGLYLATPPVFMILAEGLQVQESSSWLWGCALMLLSYLVSGISAGLFMGRFINHPWEEERLPDIYDAAFSGGRRFLHHGLYWLGLLAGLAGLLAARVECWLS